MMNKIISALCISIIIAGCDNSLDPYLPEDPFPVIYGVICPRDTVNKIIIRKSISCGDSIELYAKYSDSLQYNELSAFLELRNPDGLVIKRTPLIKTLDEPRDIGFLSNEPNWIYTCLSSDLLNPDEITNAVTVALSVYSPKWETSAFAQTIIPPAMVLMKPANDLPYELNMLAEKSIVFEWERSTKYYVEFNTHIVYFDFKGGKYVKKEFVHKRKWKPWAYSDLERIVINGDWFYPLMAARIIDDPLVEYRKFGQIDFEILTADPAFSDYFASIYYRSDYESNLLGNVINGKGVFVAYNRRDFDGYGLSSLSLDSLALGRTTREFRFIRW